MRLSILIYHRVLPTPDPLLPGVPDVRQFDRQMGILRRGFHVLPLSVAIQHLHQGTLPARAAAITFDDGYADNAEYALPILLRHGLSATFFIASAYLDGGQMWNDHVIAYARRNKMSVPQLDDMLRQLKYLPFDARQRVAESLAPIADPCLMLRRHQVKALAAAGMEIGAHTHQHPILSRMEDDDARRDIARGKAVLENITQQAVSLFAYPNGKPGLDYDQRHVAMVADAGFKAACSTATGVAYEGSDLLQLPRFTPWEPDRLRFLLRLLQQRRHGV